MSKRKGTAYAIAVFAIVAHVFVIPPQVSAAPSPSSMSLVHLAPSDARQFQRAMASLASQAHVALVAEGVPLKPALSAAEAVNLTAEMPLDQAVSKMAAAYDYDAQRQGSVFVLIKRYSDSHDLPCVTLAECQRAADDLSDVLNVFNPNFATSIYANGPDGRREAVVSFFESLSPAQLQSAQNKTLYYGSLSPSQQAIIQKIFLYQYVQSPLDEVKGAINYLDYAPQSAIKARDENGYSGLFMEVPNLYAGGPPNLLSLSGGLTPLDRPQPSMVRALPPASVDAVLLQPTTLRKLTSGLKPVNGKLPLVDASLADKPVTVAGIDNAETMAVLKALAALYGLDLEAPASERPRLKPHAVLLPTSLKEIDAAVWASLPVSYVRALHIAPAVASIPAKPSASAAALPDFPNQMRLMQLPASLQQEANNRLLLAIQPPLKKQGLSVRVPVKSLDSSTQAALAISLMTTVIATLHDGFSGSPHQSVLNCVDNMNQTVIYTVQGEDAHFSSQDVPSLYLEGTDLDTKQHVGLGGVRYFSNN